MSDHFTPSDYQHSEPGYDEDFPVEPRDMHRGVLYESNDGAIAIGVDGQKCGGVYLTSDEGLPIGYADPDRFSVCPDQAAAWVAVAIYNRQEIKRKERIMQTEHPNANGPGAFVPITFPQAKAQNHDYLPGATRVLVERTKAILDHLPPDSPAKAKMQRSIECVEYPSPISRVERLLKRIADESDTLFNIISEDECIDILEVIELAKGRS